jgi:hypothetical protein
MRVADSVARHQWGCAPIRKRCATHVLLQRRAQVLGRRSWPPWRGTRARPYVTLEAHAARDTVGRWQARARQGQRHCGASFFPPRRSPSPASVEGGALDRAPPGGVLAAGTHSSAGRQRVSRAMGRSATPCVLLRRAGQAACASCDSHSRSLAAARVLRRTSSVAGDARWCCQGADRLTAPPRPRAPCGGWGLVPISMGSVVHTRGLRASARSLACEPTHRPPRQVSPLRT